MAVARGIAGSSEFREALVKATYHGLLERGADRSGLAFWTARLSRSSEVDDLRAALLGSDEFLRKAGSTSDGFARALYRAVLGRAVDTRALAHVLGRLEAGETRASIAKWIVASPEADRRSATYWYQAILGRGPTTAEADAWADGLRNGRGEMALVAALAVVAN